MRDHQPPWIAPALAALASLATAPVHAAPGDALQWQFEPPPTSAPLPLDAPPSPDDVCPTPTADECADAEYYRSSCGARQVTEDSVCSTLLRAQADAATDGLPLQPLARCPVGAEASETQAQQCAAPPADVDAIRDRYDASGMDTTGNAASYGGELQAAQRDIGRGGLRAALRSQRYRNWRDNCGVFSCEEFVREKYYTWSRFEDEAMALGDDYRGIYDLVFAPGGLRDREVDGQPRSHLALSRFDGTDAPALPLSAPKRNVYLQFYQYAGDDYCAFPNAAESDNCSIGFTVLENVAVNQQLQERPQDGMGCARPTPQERHYWKTREDLEALIDPLRPVDQGGTPIASPDGRLDHYSRVLSWHQDASDALAATYSDDYLLWWAERQVYFRSLWRELRARRRTLQFWQCGDIPYNTAWRQFFETAEKIEQELALAAQAGCLDAGHINPCDWSPRSLQRALLFAADPVFETINPEQAASFNAAREADYQRCTGTTANNFDPVVDAEWLVQAHASQGAQAFCASSEPGGRCAPRPAYADSSRSVEAYFDAVQQWFESLQLPRDPETGQIYVGDSHSDSGTQGDTNFSVKFGYGMGWTMSELQRQKLCEARVTVTSGLYADVKVFGRSTGGGNAPHLALLESTVDSQAAGTTGSAGFFINDQEIFSAPEGDVAPRVYVTEDLERDQRLFGTYSETFVVFGFPIVVRAGVTGTVGLDFEFSAGRSTCNAGQEQELTVDARTRFVPYANVRAYAQAGVEMLIAEAGVRADLTVLALELPFEANVGAYPIVDDCRGAGPGGVCLEAGATLDYGLNALSGAVSVYLDVDYGLREKHYSRGLFSWPGLRVGPSTLLSTEYAFPLDIVHNLLRDGDDDERLPPAGGIASLCPGGQEPITLAGLLAGVEGACTPVTVTHTIEGLATPVLDRLAYVLSDLDEDEGSFYADPQCGESTRILEFFPGDLTRTIYVLGAQTARNIEIRAPGMQPLSLTLEPSDAAGPATQWALFGPDEIGEGSCVPYSIAATDAADAVAAVTDDVTVYLDAVGGTFFADAACSRPMDELDMLAGDSVATAFFLPNSAAPTLNIDGGSLAASLPLDLIVQNVPGGPTCGDGTLDPGEGCDDGNGDSRDGCSGVCIVEAGFECAMPDSPCSELPDVTCGDNVAEGFEGCDRGPANGIACTPAQGDACWYCNANCAWQSIVSLVGVFVSTTTGDDGNAGTSDAPLATLTEALSRGGATNIYLAGGTYAESPVATGRDVYGSYNPADWSYDGGQPTVIDGVYTIRGGGLHDVKVGGLTVGSAAFGTASVQVVEIEGPARGNPATLVDVQGTLECFGCIITLTGATGGQRAVHVWNADASLSLDNSLVQVPLDAEFVPGVEQRNGADLIISGESMIRGSIGVRSYYAAADPTAQLEIADSHIVGGFLGVVSQLPNTTLTGTTVDTGYHVPAGFAASALQLYNNGVVPSAVIDSSTLRANAAGTTYAIEGIGQTQLLLAHSVVIGSGSAAAVAVELDRGEFTAAHSYFAGSAVASLSLLQTSPATFVNDVFDLGGSIYAGQLGTAVDPSGITLVSNRFVNPMGTLLQVVGNGGPLQIGAGTYNACGWGCLQAFGNSTGDPGFTNVGTRDFTLTGGSTLRDAGVDPTPWIAPSRADHDLYGNLRPIGGGWDIGPSEQ